MYFCSFYIARFQDVWHYLQQQQNGDRFLLLSPKEVHPTHSPEQIKQLLIAQGYARVIEVGVDVPNATCMVVLDADRFGIAQLHQLRGRVGRGVIASRCWLVTSDPEVSSPRVDALVESKDGFYLAEVDLELRGEGTIMKTAQKGRSDLKLASLRRDRDLIEL